MVRPRLLRHHAAGRPGGAAERPLLAPARRPGRALAAGNRPRPDRDLRRRSPARVRRLRPRGDRACGRQPLSGPARPRRRRGTRRAGRRKPATAARRRVPVRQDRHCRARRNRARAPRRDPERRVPGHLGDDLPEPAPDQDDPCGKRSRCSTGSTLFAASSARTPSSGPSSLRSCGSIRPTAVPRFSTCSSASSVRCGPILPGRRSTPCAPACRWGRNVADDVRVSDNPSELRYELFVDGELAGLIRYRRLPDALALVHTEVEPRFEGRGLAARLVAGRTRRHPRARAAHRADLPVRARVPRAPSRRSRPDRRGHRDAGLTV